MLKREISIFVTTLLIVLMGLALLYADLGEWQEGGLVIDSGFKAFPHDKYNKQQHLKPITSDGLGGVIIAWTSRMSTVGNPGSVFVQRTDPDGNLLFGDEDELLNVEQEVTMWANVVLSDSGEVIVSWTDDQNIMHPEALKIDYSGTILWDTLVVLLPDNVPNVEPHVGDLFNARLISDGDGGAIASAFGDSDDTIYVQRVSSGGTKLWGSEGVKLPYTIAEERIIRTAIASDNAKGVIVAWVNDTSKVAPSMEDIHAQRIDSSGTVMWDSGGVVICNNSKKQYDPDMIPDGNGGAFITWCDERKEPDPDMYMIYAQRIDEDGDALWQSNGIPACSVDAVKFEPVIISDDDGGGIIVWKDMRVGGDFFHDWNVYAQRIDEDGNLIWDANAAPVCVVDSTHQQEITACPDGDNGAIIAWIDERDSEFHVYAQRIDKNGKDKWKTGGIPICTSADDCHAPYVCYDGVTGAFIYWHNWPSPDNVTCYVQKIDSYFDFPTPDCSLTVDVIDTLDTKDFLVGCPKGDWESLKLTLDFDENDVPRDIEKSEITLDKPDTVATFWNQGDIVADSAAIYGDTIRTTITHSCFSRDYCDTCGIDSVALIVRLNDTTVCDVESLIVKSPDYTGDGEVGISDFVYFSFAYPSAKGDTNYNEWFEFTGNDTINSTDYSMFGSHYTHEYSEKQGFRFKLEDESDVKIKFVITQPDEPSKNGIVYVKVYLVDALDVTTTCIGLDFNHEKMDYVTCVPNSDFPGTTIVSPISWNGRNPLIISGFKMDIEGNNANELGLFEFKLKGEKELGAISNMGLNLVFGDVLYKNGLIGRIKTLEFEQKATELYTPIFRNYLGKNYPNPFNPATTIYYSIANDTHVNLSVYNVNGQLVRTLVNEFQKKNNYKYVWGGKNNRGSTVASGIYFLRMKTESYTMTRKMVIVR